MRKCLLHHEDESCSGVLLIDSVMLQPPVPNYLETIYFPFWKWKYICFYYIRYGNQTLPQGCEHFEWFVYSALTGLFKPMRLKMVDNAWNVQWYAVSDSVLHIKAKRSGSDPISLFVNKKYMYIGIIHKPIDTIWLHNFARRLHELSCVIFVTSL